MSSFRDLFTDTAAPMLLENFGESIVYHPGDTDVDRPIVALVERGSRDVIAELGEQYAQAIIIRVTPNEALGIDPDEVDTGIDEVTLALRYGGKPERRTIVKVLGDDGGLLQLLVQ